MKFAKIYFLGLYLNSVTINYFFATHQVHQSIIILNKFTEVNRAHSKATDKVTISN